MRMKAWIALALLVLVAATGCSNNKELLAQKDQQITDLEQQVQTLQGDLATERQRANQLNKDLELALADYAVKEVLLLEQVDNKSVITVSDAMMFSSGSVQLTQGASEMLDAIVGVINQYPDREIRVEGHTDNVGISLEFQERFKSNWELSTARATSVVHYLRRKADVAPERVAAVGYGEYRPVADNSTPEGRSQNRRVVITIGPKL
jgi:chemotaxis protein MotB